MAEINFRISSLEQLQQWSKKVNIDAFLKKNQLQQWSNTGSKSNADEQ